MPPRRPPLPRRRTLLLALLLGLPVLALATYLLALARAQGAWGGSAPPTTALGQRLFAAQAAKALDCQGVIATPRDTWLLGGVEGPVDDKPGAVPAPVALEALLPGATAAADDSRSYLSRRDAQGIFRVVATVPAAACLQASPDGTRLLLLTGLERPESAAGAPAQTAVFRSDDRGASWRWMQAGLFPEAGRLAQYLAPTAFGPALWQWGSLTQAEMDQATRAALMAAALAPEAPATVTVPLYYAPAPGHPAQRLDLPALFTPPTHAETRLPAGAQLASAAHGDTRLYIVQTAPDRARAWVSQRFPYSYPDALFIAGYVRRTASARLVRQDGHWQVEAPQYQEGLFLEAVAADADGRVFAALNDHDGPGAVDHIAELDAAGSRWQRRSALPNPFGWLPAARRTAMLRAGPHALLLSLRAQHTVPRALYPWGERPATVSGGGDYVSTDGGRRWTRLPQAEMLGLDPVGARLFVADAPWFDSRDLTLRSWRLAD